MTRHPHSPTMLRADSHAMMASKRASTISIQTTLILARLVLVALAILLPIGLIQTFAPISVDTRALDATLLAHRLVLSPQGLGFFDSETQQAPLGVMDAGKLEAASADPQYLSNLVRFPDQKLAAKITVGSLSAYYNKGVYDDYAALAKSRLAGRGGADSTIFTLPLLIRSQGMDAPANAVIEVIQPR